MPYRFSHVVFIFPRWFRLGVRRSIVSDHSRERKMNIMISLLLLLRRVISLCWVPELRELFVRRNPSGVTVGQRRVRKAADGSAGQRHLHRVLDSNGDRLLRHPCGSVRISADQTGKQYNDRPSSWL